MMMTKRIKISGIFLGVGLMLLSGCKEDIVTAPTKEIKPTYKVSVTNNTPPFSFLDDKGKPQGIDVDMIQAIGALEGFNVVFVPTSWNGMFEQIDKNTSDMAVSGISYKPERAEKYALSKSYFYNPSSMIYLDTKSNIQGLSDLKGLKIGFNQGGKSQQYAQSVAKGIPVASDSPFLVFQSVVKGDTDVGIYDQPVFVHFAKKFPNYHLKITPIETPSDPKAQTVVLMSKINPELVRKVNSGIDKLKASGKLTEIEKKWTNDVTGTTSLTNVSLNAQSTSSATKVSP